MTKQPTDAPPEKRSRNEKITPFIERSITELIGLFAQLFTTPFAFLRYNKPFEDQVTALAKDDLEPAYPETVARPLSFFVLMMGVHLLLSGIYWRMITPGGTLSGMMSRHGPIPDTAQKIFGLFKSLSDKVGKGEAIIIIAFAATLIIAVKAYLISFAGYLLRCPIRFKIVLYASAYALGTLIFFQYIFISARYLSAIAFGNIGFQLGYAIVVYGSLILCLVLVIRINQVIRQAEGTAELPTYAAWFIGTIIWQFVIILCAIYILKLGDLTQYWRYYSEWWTSFAHAHYPPAWFGN